MIPFNDYGWAEYYEEWHFTTEEVILPPTPLYIYPDNHEDDVYDTGLVMYWGPPPGREEFPPDSFFDVFCDIDPLFLNPPIYSGPAPAPPDPFNPPGQHCCYLPDLELGTLYYWKVVVTDPATELSTEGPIWDFTTTTAHVEHPVPQLILPLEGETGISPAGTDLTWSFDPWMVDSFFDVFCDIDPDFPNPPVYSGYVSPSRTILAYHMADLLAEQPYYWYVRYNNLVDFWYSDSPLGMFSTGSGMLPSPILSIVPGGILSWTMVPGAEYYKIYRSEDPYGPFQFIAYTEEFSWMDTEYPQEKAFYRVTAVADMPPGRPVREPLE